MTILIVGLGAAGQRHARNLRRLLGEGVRLIAWRTVRTAPLLDERMVVHPKTSVEAAYGIEPFDTLEDALEERPTAVFVCNPSSLHVPVAMAAADAGCHLFIEKPLSHTLQNVDELVERVARRQLVAAIGFQMRFHPCLTKLQTLLNEEVVGSPAAVFAEFSEYLPDWHPYEDYRQSYAARRELGGGVVLTQIHDLDYLQWLFGPPRRLVAMGGRFGALDVDVEDTASMLMECGRGARVVPVHVHQQFAGRRRVRCCRIACERGTLVADFLAPDVRVLDVSGREVACDSYEVFERNQLFLDELSHFLACVEGREEPRVSLREGAVSLRMALAALESIQTGRAVDLSHAWPSSTN